MTTATRALPEVPSGVAGSDPSYLLARAMDFLATAAGVLAPTGSVAGLPTPRVVTPAEALHELIAGRGEGALQQLGIPVTDARLTVIKAPREVLVRLCSLGLASGRPVQLHREHEWLVLFPGVPRTSGADVADRDARRLLEQVRRSGQGGWCAGISGCLRVADELPAAYRDASDAAALADLRGENVVSVDDDWARLTVARLRSVAVTALPARSPLDVLVEYDRSHDSALVASLSAWLNANTDFAAAASSLSIHPNTLRYRVRRAAELAGLDLDDAQQRLVLQLAAGPE